MGFNFGAFAGGLSQGIQAGQKIALEQEQLEATRDKAAKALKKEEVDANNRVARLVGTHNTELTELKIKMDNAETPQEFNTYAEAINNKINSFTKISQAEKDSGLLPKTAVSLYDNARVSGVEPLETVTIKNHNNEDVTVSIPKSMAELANNKDNKDSVVLMENGKLSVGVMGTDNKIASYQPTDISPTKFKAPEVEDKKVLVAISPDGKKITDAFSNSDINSWQQKGYRFETSYKPKDTTIIRTGDNKPTAYSTVAVDSLPEAEQKILLDKGYKLTDKVTNETRSRLIGYDNKPTKETYGDRLIAQYDSALEDGTIPEGTSLPEYKALQEASGAGQALEKKVEAQVEAQDKVIQQITKGKDIISIVPDSKESQYLNSYFKIKNDNKPLFSTDNEKFLETTAVLSTHIKDMTSGDAKEVSGFADNIITNIESFTGIGVDVEEGARLKSVFEQMGYSMARTMNGTGVLTDKDVNHGKVALGSLWESDRALAGKTLGLVKDTVTKLESIRKSQSTDKTAFDFYYGKTLATFKALKTGLENPETKGMTRDELLNKPTQDAGLNMNIDSIRQRILDKRKEGK